MKKLFILVIVALSFSKTFAVAGSTLDFNGNNNIVNIPTNSTLNVSKFTIETWVYWKTSSAPLDFICAKGLEQLEIHTDPNNNRIRFIPASGVYLDADNNSFPKDTWLHLACVYDPSIGFAKIYINGVDISYTKSGSGTLNTSVNANASDLILGSRNGGSFPLTGRLDEFRLWNRVLSQTEIQAKMNCEIPTNAYGLVANYHFNQGTASGMNTNENSLLDATSFANNGQLINFNLSGNTSNWISPGAIANGSMCAIAGNTSGCSKVTLTVSGGVSYNWSGGDMPTSSVNNFTASGLFTVTITDDNMNQTVAAEYVVVSTIPSAPIVVSPTSICGVGNYSNLVAQGTNLTWYSTNSGSTTLGSNLTFVGQNTFYVSQSPLGCESARATFIVFAKELSPMPTVAGVQSFCGTAYVYNLTALGQNLTWYYNNNYNSNLDQNDELEDDTYYVTQNTNGCKSNFAPSQVLIIRIPELYIEAMPSSNINAGENVDFNLSTSNVGARPIFQWFIDNVPVGRNEGELIGSTFQNNAVVKCVITVANGCLNNNVYSATQNISIRKTFSKNYSFLSSFGTQGNGFGQFNSPEGLFMTSNGYIYVSDYSNNRVSVWTQSGTNFLPLTSFGSTGSSPTEFNGASAVAVAPNGMIFVADYSGHRISVWTQDGINFTNINTFGSQGSAINQLNYPIDINFDAHGHIFVCDYNNNRISVWTQSGNNFGVMTTFGGNNLLNRPSSLVFGANNQMLISEYQGNKISVWTQSGNNFGVVTTFGGIDANSNLLYYPFKLFAGADNKIFFSDRYTNKIIVLSQSGNNFEKISEISGLSSNSFDFPSSVWETADKKVYVADSYNNRISIWQPCLEPSTIVTQPISVSKCPDGPAAVFSVSVAGITPVQYEWNNESSNPSITVSGKTRGSFKVKVSGCGTFVSNYAKVINIPQTEIENTLETKLICANTYASFTISAIGENLKYKWSDGLTTTTSFMTSTLGTSVTVTVSGTCGTEISETAMVYGMAETKITQQPISLSTCVGATVVFDMFATGESLKYMWSNGLSTTTSMTTSVPSNNYNITVTGTCGTKISNTVSLLTLAGTKITHQPTSETLCGGNSAHFNITALGNNLSYHWSNGLSTTTSMTTSVPSNNYNMTVTGTCGTEISSTVSLLTLAGTKITHQPTSETLCGGNFAHFNITALGNNLSYHWSNGLSTTTSMTTSVPSNNYNMTVTGTCGTEISSTVSLLTLAGTKITHQPTSETLCGGNFAHFNITALGNNLTYHWSNGLSTTTSMTTSVPSNNYNITVTGTCGTEISNTVSLLTLAGTKIISEPMSQTIQPNASANLSISASGVDLTYKWSTNETVAAISNKPVGVYFVTVSGTCGTIVTSATILGIGTFSGFSATVSGLFTNTTLSNIINNVLVSITGFGFANGASATIGGVVLTNMTINGNIITGAIPAGSTMINPSNPIVIVQNPGENPTTPIAQVPVIIATTSTNLPIYELGKISIYPNPINHGNFTISNTTVGSTLLIYNSQAKLVFTQVIINTETNISVALVSGIYLVKIGNETQKIIVE